MNQIWRTEIEGVPDEMGMPVCSGETDGEMDYRKTGNGLDCSLFSL